MKNSQGAEDSVVQGGGPHEGDDADGDLGYGHQPFSGPHSHMVTRTINVTKLMVKNLSICYRIDGSLSYKAIKLSGVYFQTKVNFRSLCFLIFYKSI